MKIRQPVLINIEVDYRLRTVYNIDILRKEI